MKVINPKISKTQIGLVSIVVTMIIMVVISLIVIAFSRLVRRDQRQALDKQLNTQAFYAAEAGVNSALEAVKAGYNQEKSNCNDPADPLYTAPYNVNPIIDASNGVKVSCLLINPFVTSLEYDNVDTAESTVVPVKLRDTSPTTISSITLSWQDASGSTSFDCPWGVGTAPELPPVSGWSCSTGVMRVDMVPFTGTQDRQALSNAMFTRFLYPSTTGANSTGYSALSQPDVYRVKCDVGSVRYCSAQFTGLNSKTVYLRLKSIYRASAVTVSCTTASSAPCELSGAQVMIDATGKANDVIKRIQVRAPLNNSNYLLPEGPITTRDSICKRYVIENNTTLKDNDLPPCGIN